MSSVIRPIDVSGVVQRSQNISQIKQHEDSKTFVDHQNFGQTFEKQVEHHLNSVVSSEKGDKKKDSYDAKEKGNGREYEKQQKGRKQKKKDEDRVIPKGQGSFDIRI